MSVEIITIISASSPSDASAASIDPKTLVLPPRPLIAHLRVHASRYGSAEFRVDDAASRELVPSTIPPATPTPSTYIHPSWKSNK